MTEDHHKQRQQKLKEQVDARIDAAKEQREILIVFTGKGKGKTTVAFGTVTLAVGHGMRTALIQFIKGEWPNGEKTCSNRTGLSFR